MKGKALNRKVIEFVKRRIRKFGFRMERMETNNFLDPLLDRRIQNRDEFFIVQIGANDGINFDTLYNFITENAGKVKGVVVEPLADVFQELVQNYRNYPQITAVNAAIHNTAKEMSLYRVDPEKQKSMPAWTKGIASFDKDFHKKSQIPIEDMLEVKVPCLSLEELIKSHDLKKIDLLQIDTEGYDFEIIRSINFKKNQPEVICFEHGRQYGTTTSNDLKNVLALLQNNGYYIMIEPDDVVAYLHDLENF